MSAIKASQSLNFSWLIDGEIAGSAAPMSRAELDYLRSQGVGAILRLAHPDKDDFVIEHAKVLASGLQDIQIPVEDFHAPTIEQIDMALSFIGEQLDQGRPVAVSCGAGCGRTGTILACYLVSRGYTAEDALTFLFRKRPCSDEIVKRTTAQLMVIREFEQQVLARKVHA